MGPKIPQGAAVGSPNALRFALHDFTVVLFGEHKAAFQQLHKGVRSFCHAENPAQHKLADDVGGPPHPSRGIPPFPVPTGQFVSQISKSPPRSIADAQFCTVAHNPANENPPNCGAKPKMGVLPWRK